MSFEKVLGFRKLILGVVSLGMAYKSTNIDFVALIYGCFCLANIVEHLSSALQKPEKAPLKAPEIPLLETENLLKKVIEGQNTHGQALQFIVQHIQSSQGVRTS